VTSTVFFALGIIALLGSIIGFLLRDLDVERARRSCSTLVLYVFLPALAFDAVYSAPLGRTVWQVPVVMLAGAITCLAVAIPVFSLMRSEKKRVVGALILGSAFGNVTYLGLPVLRGLFPNQLQQVTEVAILCEVTVTSLDLIAASVLAPFYGGESGTPLRSVILQLIKFPLLWSALIAVVFNICHLPVPDFAVMALHLLGQTVSGLMLLILGMALRSSAVSATLGRASSLAPPLLIKLALSPLIVLFLGRIFKLPTLALHATTVEAAMPPQLFTLIVADRFNLDTENLAVAVMVLTSLSFLTVPLDNWLLI
jgi:malate permease and related proteins